MNASLNKNQVQYEVISIESQSEMDRKKPNMLLNFSPAKMMPPDVNSPEAEESGIYQIFQYFCFQFLHIMIVLLNLFVPKIRLKNISNLQLFCRQSNFKLIGGCSLELCSAHAFSGICHKQQK